MSPLVNLCILAAGVATGAGAVAAADDDDAHRGPVVVMDVGDNIGGGSAADSTILLKEALAARHGACINSPFKTRIYSREN